MIIQKISFVLQLICILLRSLRKRMTTDRPPATFIAAQSTTV